MNKLWKWDMEVKDGKMVRIRNPEISVWCGVHIETGQVETSDCRHFDDDLEKMVTGWEWKKFILVPVKNVEKSEETV